MVPTGSTAHAVITKQTYKMLAKLKQTKKGFLRRSEPRFEGLVRGVWIPCRAGRTPSWLGGSWTGSRTCSIPPPPSAALEEQTG